jgi:hypothetical protein
VIRSSALLIAVALAVLVAGVLASSLGLIYVSILVSILAAVVLCAGIIVRRREIFGVPETAPEDAPRDRPAVKARGVAMPATAPLSAGPGNGEAGDLANGARKAAARGPSGQSRSRTRRGPAEPEPVSAGDTDGELGWPPRKPDREYAPSGDDQPRVPSRAEHAEREPEPEPERAAPWARREREGAGRSAAGSGPAAVPGPSGVPGPAAAPGPAARDPSAGDFRDRVNDEVAGSGRRPPARPAWPATGGPRAMGGEAGAASQYPAGKPEDSHAEPPEPVAAAEPAEEVEEPAPLRESTFLDRRERAREQDDKLAAAGSGTGNAAWSAWRATKPHDGHADATEAAERTGAGKAEDVFGRKASDAGAGKAEAGAIGSGDGAETAGAVDAGPAREEPVTPGPEPGRGEDLGDEPAEDQAERPAEDRAERPAEDRAEEPSEGGPEERGGEPATSAADKADRAALSPDAEVTVVPGVARYHRRGCILIRFLSDGDLETMTRRASQDAGSVACKACQPDEPSADD